MFLSVYNFRNNTQKFSFLKSLTLKNKNKRVKIKEGYLFQISSAYQKYYIISQVFLCSLTNSKGTQNGGKGQRLPLTITHSLPETYKHWGAPYWLRALHELWDFEPEIKDFPRKQNSFLSLLLSEFLFFMLAKR